MQILTTLFLSLFFISALSFANGIDDIEHLDCKNNSGSYFILNKITKTVEAKFAGMNLLTNSNYGEEKFVEVLHEYPSEDFDSIGALANDSSGLFGNTSVLFKKNQVLQETEKGLCFFMDQLGNRKTEDLDCKITFKK